MVHDPMDFERICGKEAKMIYRHMGRKNMVYGAAMMLGTVVVHDFWGDRRMIESYHLKNIKDKDEKRDKELNVIEHNLKPIFVFPGMKEVDTDYTALYSELLKHYTHLRLSSKLFRFETSENLLMCT